MSDSGSPRKVALLNKLKPILPSQLPPLIIVSSDLLHPSPIPSGSDPRAFYLALVGEASTRLQLQPQAPPPPLISCSEFVPPQMVELLMRRKKDSALGVKFVGSACKESRRLFGPPAPSRTADDEITDMEGAMHSFVTPVVARCEMVGDYKFDAAAGGHGICSFGEIVTGEVERRSHRLTRTVSMSASIQLDFENSRVMLKLCLLESQPVVGCDLSNVPCWEILSTQSKQDDEQRKEYDEELRRHMVFHLTRDGRLPARKEVRDAMNVHDTIRFLEEVIFEQCDVRKKLEGKYAVLQNSQIVSLELLFNAAFHQVRNEFSALEALFPQGYVYTYDPASIFARQISAPILNRLMLAALKHLSNHSRLENLRVFAFNDYADASILNLVRVGGALKEQPNVRVVGKKKLFGRPGGLYEIGGLSEARDAMLVVHNNSDGFGQNIETESSTGSLDGAIGSNSSAAASLERGRQDLLDFVC